MYKDEILPGSTYCKSSEMMTLKRFEMSLKITLKDFLTDIFEQFLTTIPDRDNNLNVKIPFYGKSQ